MEQEGDIAFVPAFAERRLRDAPKPGVQVGFCFLPETPQSACIRWPVRVIGVGTLRGTRAFVAAIPGRCDLFVGRWHDHATGPSLIRLEGLSLPDTDPLPRSPSPSEWPKLPDGHPLGTRLADITREVLGLIGTQEDQRAISAEAELLYEYRLAVLALTGMLKHLHLSRGLPLTDGLIAKAIHVDWTEDDLLRPARPSFSHALGVGLATCTAMGVTAAMSGDRSWPLAKALLVQGFAADTGVGLPVDAAESILISASRQLATVLPEFVTSGPLTDWAALRKSSPESCILLGLHRSQYTRLIATGNGAVQAMPPARKGTVIRGGAVDNRERWRIP